MCDDTASVCTTALDRAARFNNSVVRAAIKEYCIDDDTFNHDKQGEPLNTGYWYTIVDSETFNKGAGVGQRERSVMCKYQLAVLEKYHQKLYEKNDQNSVAIKKSIEDAVARVQWASGRLDNIRSAKAKRGRELDITCGQPQISESQETSLTEEVPQPAAAAPAPQQNEVLSI